MLDGESGILILALVDTSHDGHCIADNNPSPTSGTDTGFHVSFPP